MTHLSFAHVLRGSFVALALAAGGVPAWAQSMTAEEFEAYVEGKTLLYKSFGQDYGVEEYLPGRKVRWAFTGDDCVDGHWYEANGLICFLYEDRNDPQCWSFEQGTGGLIARFENNPAATELYETLQTDQRMACMGPKIGA